ncbi:carboxypeptidase B-like isoform X2 [Ostrea edulis]|uniref:carboxypeptidase B-like isoform X2 n=1 Tax=Ostrea edulis TaxID=37623 RepID=UPI002095A54E|nr:carboxypeptidase B-like isoform X2 [Ostrea edulis]
MPFLSVLLSRPGRELLVIMPSCILVLLIFCGCAAAEPARFDGHKVLQIVPHTTTELENVLALHDLYNLDVWRHPRKHNYSMDVYVEPEKLQPVLTALKDIGADVKIWIDDLQKLIDAERQPSRRRTHVPSQTQRNASLFDHFRFNRFADIKKYLNDVVTLTQSMSTVNASLVKIGDTYLSNEILLLKISRGDGRARPSIFIDGGIHAREWIAPATVLYFIRELVNGGVDDYASQLLDKFDWYLAPVLNPDGYEYSHTNYRLWRKNRVDNGRNCHGTDLNRNFGHNWNPAIGGSTNVCSDVYSGKSAFSEAESRAVESFILNNNKDMIAYLTYHSYGEMWLYPWGYTSALPVDWQDLDSAAKTATSALSELYGTQYLVGSSTNVLYSAAGGSDDWAKGDAGVKYSYTIELRDTGAHGFVLPEDQIRPNGEESWRALRVLALSLSTTRH